MLVGILTHPYGSIPQNAEGNLTMWYYNQTKPAQSAAPKPASRESLAKPGRPEVNPALAAALGGILASRPVDPDAYLLMAILVDSEIKFADGKTVGGLSWSEAERILAANAPSGDPLRLYNRFAREFGDGYTQRDELTADERRALTEIATALVNANGITSVESRTLGRSMPWVQAVVAAAVNQGTDPGS